MIAIIISILLSLGLIDSPQDFHDFTEEQREELIIEDLFHL